MECRQKLFASKLLEIENVMDELIISVCQSVLLINVKLVIANAVKE
jgi:hypothetical protein